MSFLHIDNVTKRFGGVTALENVDFHIRKGAIHAVMGENGAGKSTLMKIVAGVYPHGSFEGRIALEGHECRFNRVVDAEAAGIALIPQELAVVAELSVAENMFLNAWPAHRGVVDWEALYDRARSNLAELELDVRFDAPMKSLSAAQQQMVLIAKALSKNVRLLVLDEPTSSLSVSEAEVLFARLRALNANGVTALYISHKIDEVLEIADAITVLRDGRHVETCARSEISAEGLVARMVGRPISQMYPRVRRTPGEVALRVRGLTAYPAHMPQEQGNEVLHQVDLDVHHGEIVGIYGLVGAGRTELLTALFGAWPGAVTADAFEIEGTAARATSPRRMMDRGLGFLTEDRKRTGIIASKSISMNLSLASLDKVSRHMLLDDALERERSQNLARDLNVKAPGVDTAIDDLSGGNQQKVLIARWLSAESRILLLDDPTRGVDVGAKVEIFNILNRLAGQGAAIIFVTSELPEVLGIADRILVMHEGRMVADLAWDAADEETIMHYAAGRGHAQ